MENNTRNANGKIQVSCPDHGDGRCLRRIYLKNGIHHTIPKMWCCIIYGTLFFATVVEENKEKNLKPRNNIFEGIQNLRDEKINEKHFKNKILRVLTILEKRESKYNVQNLENLANESSVEKHIENLKEKDLTNGHIKKLKVIIEVHKK